jgi:hypothetical protein
MLENSLKIREKYVNKIKAKVDSLNESISLLEKVDKQLMRDQVQMGGARLEQMIKSYNNIQAGGAASSGPSTSAIDFKAVQESALRKKAEILLQRKSIEELNKNIAKLSEGFKPINDVLGNVKRLIDSIQIELPTLAEAKPPSIGDWSPLAQYNLYHNKSWAEIVAVANLTAANGEIDFNVFNKVPADNGATPGTDADRESIKGHLVAQLGAENVSNIEEMYNAALLIVHPINAAKGGPSSGPSAAAGLPENLTATPSAPSSPKPAASASKYRFF